MRALALEPWVLVGAGLALAGLVAVALALSALRGRRADVVARLLPPGARGASGAAPAAGPRSALTAVLRPLARLAAPTGEEASLLRLRLQRAGLRREHAAQAFLAAKVALALALVAAFAWVQAARAERMALALPVAVVLAAAGFYAPNLWLSSRVTARQRAVGRGLADALDLLVTCVEAGLGLDAALVRVAAEIRLPFPVLAEELQLTFLEVKAGLPRAEAFRRLSDRTGVDDLKQLSATLTQTEMFGTSVGLALRVQASGMRARRMQRAEERAAVVSVKMTLPLVFCILPSLFTVIMGPAVVNITESLIDRMG